MSSYRDLWYESADGLRLYARDYPCTNPALSATDTILCMHGLTRNSADFSELAQYLRAQYRVIAVDQRGRGKSDYDSVIANYTPITYVRDMFTLLDELALDKVILIGTSMGGLMSFLMCAMHSARIRATVINDIGPELDPVGLARIKSHVGRGSPVANWEEAVAQNKRINGAAFTDFSEQQWLDFTRGQYKQDGGALILNYDPAIAQPMVDDKSGAVPADLWPIFEAGAGIPMLVIRGEHSDILAPQCLAQMHAKRSNLHSAVIPRRGHAPTLTEPASIAAIDRFLHGI